MVRHGAPIDPQPPPSTPDDVTYTISPVGLHAPEVSEQIKEVHSESAEQARQAPDAPLQTGLLPPHCAFVAHSRPTPLREADVLPPAVAVRLADFVPVVVGSNLTDTVQLLPAPSVIPLQPSAVLLNWLACVPPMSMVMALVVEPPVLVTVKTWVGPMVF